MRSHHLHGYIKRWLLLQTRWGNIYLHRIEGPDPTGTQHTHPFSFWSLLLRGEYAQLQGDRHLVRQRRFLFFDRGKAHAITSVKTPCWTLVVTGPWHPGSWGFIDDDGNWNPMPITDAQQRVALLLENE